jgi:hypothetical protein
MYTKAAKATFMNLNLSALASLSFRAPGVSELILCCTCGNRITARPICLMAHPYMYVTIQTVQVDDVNSTNGADAEGQL